MINEKTITWVDNLTRGYGALQSIFNLMGNVSDAFSITGGEWIGQATELLKELENPQGPWLTPHFDTNKLRIGFSSDTVTDEFGKIDKVVELTRVTVEDAMRDLQRRIKEAGGTIQEQIGPEAWAKLSESAKAALVSIAYNFGDLSAAGNVLAAAMTGDHNAIAQAILDLKGLDEGINDNRREREAALVAGEATVEQFVAQGEAAADAAKQQTDAAEQKAEAAKREAEAQADLEKQYDLSIANRIKLLDLEKQLLADETLSAAERERLLAIQAELLSLHERGIPITAGTHPADRGGDGQDPRP